MENKNHITIYNNDMNTVAFRKFTSSELDLLMVILHKMKNEGLNIIKFSFDELK